MTGEGDGGRGGRVGGHWPVEEKAAGWEDDERIAGGDCAGRAAAGRGGGGGLLPAAATLVAAAGAGSRSAPDRLDMETTPPLPPRRANLRR